jgi:hypothetical protein
MLLHRKGEGASRCGEGKASLPHFGVPRDESDLIRVNATSFGLFPGFSLQTLKAKSTKVPLVPIIPTQNYFATETQRAQKPEIGGQTAEN